MIKPGGVRRPPWSSYKSVKKMKKTRKKQEKVAKDSGLYADQVLCDNVERELQDTIHKAKGHFENNLVDKIKDKPKLFWNYTIYYSRSSSTIDFLIGGNRRLVKDNEKADALNNFFASTQKFSPIFGDFMFFDFKSVPKTPLKKCIFLFYNNVINKIHNKQHDKQ